MKKTFKNIVKNYLTSNVIDKQTVEADRLLTDIAKMTNREEADYYAKNLNPKNAMYRYDNSTYLMLLEEVKKQIFNGCRDRTSKETVLANARIKVLI